MPVSCITQKAARIASDQVTDLSGRWNDTDAKLVAEAMSEDFSNGNWLTQFQQAQAKPGESNSKRRPVIIVGDIFNKSHEHIEADTFVKGIEKALIERGVIRIVANSILREKLRQEKGTQADFTSEDTKKEFGKELGANYMLFGTITAIVDTEGKNKTLFYKRSDKVIFYQVSLELVDLETNEKVWMGDKKLKKYVKSSSLW